MMLAIALAVVVVASTGILVWQFFHPHIFMTREERRIASLRELTNGRRAR